MKKIITSVVALMFLGSISFAQDAAKPAPKKSAHKKEAKATGHEMAAPKKEDKKMNAASEKKMGHPKTSGRGSKMKMQQGK